ncbi:hypothetical protein WJX73_006203 [Symbiochloris irregularis]|uniref:F-box domain-containing protein n=1 Tax=Symbiochloris irregularis TaxID=706552 RepID=A0AAW1PQI6_9CHLO
MSATLPHPTSEHGAKENALAAMRDANLQCTSSLENMFSRAIALSDSRDPPDTQDTAASGRNRESSLISQELQDVTAAHLLPLLTIQALGSLACSCRTMRALTKARHGIWAAAARASLLPHEASGIHVSADRASVQHLLLRRYQAQRNLLAGQPPAHNVLEAPSQCMKRHAARRRPSEMSFSPDGGLLAANFEGECLAVYEAAVGKELRCWSYARMASWLNVAMTGLRFVWADDNERVTACACRDTTGEPLAQLPFIDLHMLTGLYERKCTFKPGPGKAAVALENCLSSMGKHAAILVEVQADWGTASHVPESIAGRYSLPCLPRALC